MSEQSKTLFLFIDESGNFDFSPKGTKFFSLTCLVTNDPITKRDELVKLRYDLLTEGVDHEYFHATEDAQKIRDKVYAILSSMGESYKIYSVIAQKNKTHSSLYKEVYYKKDKLIERVTGIGLYQQLCKTLLKYIFVGNGTGVQKIVVVLGSLFVGDKKKVILGTLKRYLKTNFENIPFEIFCHQTCSDLNCQLADYCCWAVAVKWERGEIRPYNVIQNRIVNRVDGTEFEIFRKGTTTYYEYK